MAAALWHGGATSKDAGGDVPGGFPGDLAGKVGAPRKTGMGETGKTITSLEEELSRRSARLDDFLATLCHDLRSPLMGILGTAESLRRGFYGDLADEPLRRVEMIEAGGWRLSRMLTEIFDLHSLGSGTATLNPTRFAAADLCRDAAAAAGPASAEAGVRVQLTIAIDGAQISADRERMLQALGGLLSHAISYSASPGPVTLTLRAAEEAGHIEFVVDDEGPCDDVAALEQLLEPYSGARRSSLRRPPGLGLEPALAAAVARVHGGHVAVARKDEGGARFVLRLPAAP